MKTETIEYQTLKPTTKNVFKVPKKQWPKWGDAARQTFNTVYDTLLKNQRVVVHPNMPEISKKHWKTIAWNSAWLAADAAN